EKESEDDENSCIVCADNIIIASISNCNHKVCHKCCFRQRALYNKKLCLVCRTENERTIFTEDIEVEEYSAISSSDIVTSVEKYGIDFTSFNCKLDTLNLLKYQCPLKQCKMETFDNFKKLNEHVREKHDRQYCTLCANFKKAFISELKLYTTRQLQTHQFKGDEEGFKGHPLCKFCSGKRFYSEDELFVHLREKHEKCHVCDQIDSTSPQYFKNYDQLFSHFREAHYICNVQSCLDQKFVVFADDLDLKSHMIKEHGNIFGNSKVLLSSSGTGFGSQLNIFGGVQNSHNGSGNRNGNGNQQRGSEIQQHDTYETKKLRLDERARHYLNYSQPQFETFQATNIAYSKNDITVSELLATYKQLFQNTSESDLNLLLYDLSALFPPASIKHKEVKEVNDKSQNRK
ncbi:hypothetical protein CANARDRAFT_179497, partial [[Candida] arabinofermentans NRRL YB-2248]